MYKKLKNCYELSELKSLFEELCTKRKNNEIADEYFNQCERVYRKKLKQFQKNDSTVISVNELNFRYKIKDPDVVQDYLKMCDIKGFTFNMLLDYCIETTFKAYRELGLLA